LEKSNVTPAGGCVLFGMFDVVGVAGAPLALLGIVAPVSIGTALLKSNVTPAGGVVLTDCLWS
jgi:hypothetical protein